jgi:hypothetical protein
MNAGAKGEQVDDRENNCVGCPKCFGSDRRIGSGGGHPDVGSQPLGLVSMRTQLHRVSSDECCSIRPAADSYQRKWTARLRQDCLGWPHSDLLERGRGLFSRRLHHPIRRRQRLGACRSKTGSRKSRLLTIRPTRDRAIGTFTPLGQGRPWAAVENPSCLGARWIADGRIS